MPISFRYFGPIERPCFCVQHWPDGPVRGGVVVCPPFGYEAVCAHRTLRRLAHHLCEGGAAVLRIDYDGTGESIGGDSDPGRVGAWRASVQAAVEELAIAGLTQITIVGVRFGATLAAQVAAADPRVTGLVLWDAFSSGRRYARTIRLLANSAEHDPTASAEAKADGVAVAGVAFTNATLAEIGQQSVPDAVLGPMTLVIDRAEGGQIPSDFAVAARAAGATVQTLSGTSGLLDGDAEGATIPGEILAAIEHWIGTCQAGQKAIMLPPPAERNSITVNEGGVQLTHRAVVLDGGLLAVETVGEGQQPDLAVITLNNGVATRIGPGRAWFDWSREWAARQWRVLRLDVSGLGDSPVRPNQVENETYPATVSDDVAAAIRYLQITGVRKVVLLGLCSGAVTSFDAAMICPEVVGVVSINGRFDRPFTDHRRDRHKRAARQSVPLLTLPLHKTPLLPAFEKVPTFIWCALDWLRLIAAPHHCLSPATTDRCQSLLVFGEREWGLRALRQRSGRRFSDLLARENVKMIQISGLDHSMFRPGPRAQVADAVRSFLDHVAQTHRF